MKNVISKFNFDYHKEIDVSGVPEGYDGFLLSSLYEESEENILHIVRDDKRATQLKSSIQFFYPKLKILYFPAWDCLPFDRSGPRLAIQAERLATLSTLSNNKSEKQII